MNVSYYALGCGFLGGIQVKSEENRSIIGSTLAAARGIAIFIAILWHVDIWLARHYPSYLVYEKTFRVLWYIPLPTFFLLIGIAFAKLIERDRIGLIANAVGLYIYLYFFWMIFYHITFLIIGQEDYGSGILPFIRKILFPAPELWFVIWISCCLLICTLTHRLPKLLQIAVSFSLLLVILEPGYKIQNLMIYNLYFMYVGIILRDKLVYIIGDRSEIAVCLCMPLYIVLTYYMFDAEPFSHPTMSVLQSCLGVCAVTSGLHVFRKTKIVKYLSILGRNSLHIYIVAPLCLALDLRVLSWIGSLGDGMASPIIQYSTILLCIIVLAQSLLVIKLIGKTWAFNAPPLLRHLIENCISLIILRFTIPTFENSKLVDHQNPPPSNS